MGEGMRRNGKAMREVQEKGESGSRRGRWGILGRGERRWGYLGLIAVSWLTASWWKQQGATAHSADWLSALPPADGGQVSGLLAWLADCPGPAFHPRFRSEFEKTDGFRNVPVSKASWDGVKLEVNLADSAAWEGLPWVGPGLAGRICRYRDRLGGFWSLDQLGEVWGMAPEAMDVIAKRCTVDPTEVVRLCADTASWNTMRKHPYIGTSGARLIERYRQHHILRSPEDLRESPAVSDSLWGLWKPYLRVCLTEE
jgi:DNA uptake protein ComE-like DNA-binding protein